MGAYYLLDKDCTEAVRALRLHGIKVNVLTEDVTVKAADFQWFNAGAKRTTTAYYEGRFKASGSANWYGEWTNPSSPQLVPAGTYVVSTAQPLGNLAASLLEPGQVDGLLSWAHSAAVQNPIQIKFFDDNFNSEPGMIRENFKSASGNDYIPVFKVLDYRAIQVETFIPITSIRIDAPAIATVSRGTTYNYGLLLNKGATSNNVVWSVSDPSFALVDDEANVYILNKTGTVRLIATDPISGLSHSITLRIAS